MDPANRALAKLLRDQRLRLNLSQDELAHRCDLDRTYISAIERGRRNVSLKAILKIGAALGFVPHVFIRELAEKIAEEEKS